MEAAVITALVAGAVAVSTAAGTIWSSIRNAERTATNTTAIEQLKLDYDRKKVLDEDRKRISKYSEPLSRSAYDLQSRLFNIINLHFIQTYLRGGTKRERDYVVNNTSFLLAQFACWTELARREIQYIDLGESVKTRQLVHLQDEIFGIWGSDAPSPAFRMFAGELRAVGEALCHKKDQTCIGYGAFLGAFPLGRDELIDAFRKDVLALESGLESSVERLRRLQNALIDLLDLLDPENMRFPSRRRHKA